MTASANSYTWIGSSGTPYTENAPAGKQYLLVDAREGNTGSSKVYISPSLFSVEANGAKYDYSYASIEDALQSTTLYSGQHTRGTILFEIPQDASGLKLFYDGNPSSNDASSLVTWDLSNI